MTGFFPQARSPLARAALIAVLFFYLAGSSLASPAPEPSVDWTRTAYFDRYNFAHGLAPDHQGNLFFAGTAEFSATNSHWTFFLTKINSSGQTQWKQTVGLSNETNAPPYSNCLSLSPNGTVLLSGRTTGSIGGQNPAHDEQAVVMNYNAQG